MTVVTPLSARRTVEPLSFKQSPIVDITFQRNESTSLSKSTFQHKDAVQFGAPKPYSGIPQLTVPEIGIETLIRILIKQGILSTALSYSGMQQELRESGHAFDVVRKARSEESEKASLEATRTKRWSTSAKVYSLLGAGRSIIAGIAMWATGAGAAGGALLIAGGILQLTNFGLEASGGWIAIAEYFADKDPKKTQVIITWMQIAITTISFILAGAAVVFGGFNAAKDAIGKAQMFFSSVAQMDMCTVFMGMGFGQKRYHIHMANIQDYDLQFTTLKDDQEEMRQRVQDGIQHSEVLFTDLYKVLQISHADTVKILRNR